LVWRPDLSLTHGLLGSISWMDARRAFLKSSCKQR
jgi:hypothetical protein